MQLAQNNAPKYQIWVGDLNSLYDFEIGLGAVRLPVVCNTTDDLQTARVLRDQSGDYQTASWIQDTETGDIVA